MDLAALRLRDVAEPIGADLTHLFHHYEAMSGEPVDLDVVRFHTVVFALVGLFSSTPETANSIGFTVLFPLTFASSVFVPAASMPDGLRQFAEANPFTTWADAVRSLWLGTPANSDVWMGFVWCVVLTAVFAPLAVARYRKVTAK